MGQILHEAKVAQHDKEDARALRVFSVNDQVLFRTPGLINKLKTSRELKRILDLNYEVGWTNNGKRHKRVVHVNH